MFPCMKLNDKRLVSYDWLSGNTQNILDSARLVYSLCRKHITGRKDGDVSEYCSHKGNLLGACVSNGYGKKDSGSSRNNLDECIVI